MGPMAWHLRISVHCVIVTAVLANDGIGLDTGTTQTIRSIIHDIRSWQKELSEQNTDRPFVTVTYAQSIDGKIALLLDPNHRDYPFQPEHSSTSSNFAVSGPESLRMTHALRSMHDAILVGGSTLSVDNPRLNNRLWSCEDDGAGDTSRPKQPRPVVLDTHLNHVKKLGNACRTANVIACCSPKPAAAAKTEELSDTVELLPCPLDPTSGRMDLRILLRLLKDKYGIKSIMVEGGASVLTAFYSQQSELIDCLCITISPKLLLWRGLASIKPMVVAKGGLYDNGKFILDQQDFATSKFLLLGSDSIFLGKLQPFICDDLWID